MEENQEILGLLEVPETKHYYLTLLNGTEQLVILIILTFHFGQEQTVLLSIIKIPVRPHKKLIRDTGEQYIKKHMILIVHIVILGKY